AQFERSQAARSGAGVAVKTQAMEAIAEKNVELAVAVLIEPGRCRQVIARFSGQDMTVISKAVSQVGIELGAGGCCQQEIGLAVAVVITPGRSTTTTRPRQGYFAERLAAVLQQGNFACAHETEVRLAVSVEIDTGDHLGIGIDTSDSGIV